MFTTRSRRAAFAVSVALLAAACGGGAESGGQAGQVRTYYVAAEEVDWNYAPSGRNEITGEPFDADAEGYVTRSEVRIGSTYTKCLYRGYTDDSFTTPQKRPESEEYLGFLGPVIRAEVGDTIKVVFKNNCSIPASIHPHGVFYSKANEGALYADSTPAEDKTGDVVPPNGTYTYTWEVPERAGPAEHDGSSTVWMYHSHADPVGDVYAGLTGFIVITARGKANDDGSPKDVDREVFSLFEVVDENVSPYLDKNVKGLKGKPDVEGEDFVESNLMHSINGFVYGNDPMITLRKGETVRWYLMGMGTEVDLHTPHWHGNTVTVNGMRIDVVNLLPASMAIADMSPDDPGMWLFHCHVADHITAGMLTRYQVVE